jgi:Ca2+-binding RTX toxin-like protein
MTIKLAAVAASIAAAGIITVGTASSASADDHPCDNGEHHGDHHCVPVPAPVPGPLPLRVIIGSRGADVLFGGNLTRDVILGLGGNDRIAGKAGNDRLLGGGGNDILIGGRGADVMNGGRGRDLCIGDTRDIFRGCERVVITG